MTQQLPSLKFIRFASAGLFLQMRFLQVPSMKPQLNSLNFTLELTPETLFPNFAPELSFWKV